MSQPAPFPILTAEDLPYLAPREGRCELAAGELVRAPPPGQGHGSVAATVLVHVGRFVLERDLGRIYAAETGFVLARDPDTVRCSDAAFVSHQRLASTVSPGPYFEGAPDLVVEVRSPGDSRPEMAKKVGEYLAAGSRAVWVVDPGPATVVVHRPGETPGTFGPTDTLDGAPVLPGFRIEVRTLLGV